MARFVEDRSTDTLFVDGSLDSLLPVNAMGRVVQAALAGLDFVAFDDRYANDAMGRPAVEPRRLGGYGLCPCCVPSRRRWRSGGCAERISSFAGCLGMRQYTRGRCAIFASAMLRR